MHANAGSPEFEVSTTEPSPELIKKLENYPDLPTPPHIAAEIIELLKDPEADYKKLMDSLVQDPALVAKILKTANSATYARRREVTNLAQALLTLGQSATTTLALSFSLVEALEKTGSSSGFTLEFFWRRSLLAGFAARILGHSLGSKRCEELFLSGLLQDIGLMMLGLVEPSSYDVLLDRMDDHAAISAREIDLFGVDHAWIGNWLLERWELPSLICFAIKNSHQQPADIEDPEILQFCACVELSGKSADVMLTNPNDAAIAKLALEMTEKLGLAEDQVLPILNKIADQVPEIESQFGMSVIDSDATNSILQRAREILTDVSLKLLKEISDLQHQTETLTEQKNRDSLTGLYNREKLDEELASWVSRAKKLQFPLSVAFMDLDGFKAVNDIHGHPAGDDVLKKTADLLTEQVRTTDILARYGGDEFVLLLGGEKKDEAILVCERILSSFATAGFSAEGAPLDLQISIGVAELSMVKEKTAAALVDAADQALLAAKAAGKARAISFDDL